MKNNENLLFKLFKEAWKAEFMTPAGRVNVSFVIILFGFHLVSSVILKSLDLIGAYVVAGISGTQPQCLLDQNSNALLYCCIGLMVVCFGCMFWAEIRKEKVRNRNNNE